MRSTTTSYSVSGYLINENVGNMYVTKCVTPVILSLVFQLLVFINQKIYCLSK